MDQRRHAALAWVTAALEGRADVDEAADHIAARVLATASADALVASLARVGAGRRVVEVVAGPVPPSVTLVLDGDPGGRTVVECYLDSADKVLGVALAPEGLDDVTVLTVQSADLSASDRASVHALFAASYDQANPSYLEVSLATLRWITMGFVDTALVGFALGEQRMLPLPRLGETRATLAGLACVDVAMRRRGLFRRLSNLALVADGMLAFDSSSILGAGRMAHPASYRIYARHPTVVPKAGTTPNDLQREVGAVVAAAYGVADFDPETFVCRGKGTPIGYPRMDQDVDPGEWELFKAVNRDRGDSLLSLIWQPVAPPGWSGTDRQEPPPA